MGSTPIMYPDGGYGVKVVTPDCESGGSGSIPDSHPSKDKIMWTVFYDMCSGGDEKEEFKILFVELPESEALNYFEERFGRHPWNVTCECCGPDYCITEHETLEEAKNHWNVTVYPGDGIEKVITRDEIKK